MIRHRWRLIVALILTLGLVAAACSSDDSGDEAADTTAAEAADTTAAATTETTAAAGGEAASGEPCKIAYVHVGPTADKGWSWAHDQGAQFVEANMPNVETTTLESIAEGPDSFAGDGRSPGRRRRLNTEGFM